MGCVLRQSPGLYGLHVQQVHAPNNAWDLAGSHGFAVIRRALNIRPIFQAEAEAEITKRWTSDSQNKLSSMVRPLIVLGSCIIFLLFALLDAFNVLCVKDAYINLLESLLLTSVGGYFVLRSADKYVKK